MIGAKLEGTSLVHPNQFEDLKEVLNENFLPFSLKSDSILKKRKALNGHGMYQLLCQLTLIVIILGLPFQIKIKLRIRLLLNS